MCGEHVAMAAVLPYVWSDACRDRVLSHPSCRFSMRMEQIARRRRTVRARWLFLHTHGAHPYTPLSEMRGAQLFSMRMEHIAKSLLGPIRAPLSLHIQSHSKRSLLGCVVVLHIIIWNYSKKSFVA